MKVICCVGSGCSLCVMMVVRVQKNVVFSVSNMLVVSFFLCVGVSLFDSRIIRLLKVSSNYFYFMVLICFFSIIFISISINGWVLQIMVVILIEICEQVVNSSSQLMISVVLLIIVRVRVKCVSWLKGWWFNMINISRVSVLIRQCQNIILVIGKLESSMNVLIELEIIIVRFICQMLWVSCIFYFYYFLVIV